MIVVGIDPGVTGALACFVGGVLHEVVDMPVFASRADGVQLDELMERWEPDFVYLEDVHAMPKNGSIAGFKLGLNAGIVTGVVQAGHIPLRRVGAPVWKKSMGLISKPKDAARGLCTELYPAHASRFTRVRDDGRADAVLIGRFGVYEQVRERNDQGHRADGPADHGSVPAADGATRHPANGPGEHQRQHPRAGGGSPGIAEVRPLVQPADPRRR